MWNIILSFLLHFMVVQGRPADLDEDFWSQIDIRSPEQLFRRIPEERYNTNTNDVIEIGDYDVLIPDKRAITMISRWGPFSNLGKQRTPIRSNLIHPENSLNTQTRGRIQGQPLRWG